MLLLVCFQQVMDIIGVEFFYGVFEGFVNGLVVLYGLCECCNDLIWFNFIVVFEGVCKFDLQGYVLCFGVGIYVGLDFVDMIVINSVG